MLKRFKALTSSIASSSVLIGLFVVMGASQSQAAALGFQEWKFARIEEAKVNLDRIQADTAIDKVPANDRSPISNNDRLRAQAKPRSPTNPTMSPAPQDAAHKSQRADQRLQQAQLNYEISQELVIADYFALYLAQIPDRTAANEIAKKLTPDQVTELILAYQKQMLNGQMNEPLPTSASGGFRSVGSPVPRTH